MEGLAKSSEPQVINHSPNTDTQSHFSPGAASWAGVPLQVYRFFGVDFARADKSAINQVSDVYKIILQDLPEPTPGRILEKLSNLEVKLGSPKIGQTRHGKLWEWLKMDESIKDARRAQKALEK